MHKVFSALSDPTRRQVLRLLRRRDMTAGEIADHFPHAKPTLSRHFGVLKEAGLIQGTKIGTSIVYTLNVSVLEDALLTFMNMLEIEPGRKRWKAK